MLTPPHEVSTPPKPAFPTSRFAPLALVRPLGVFGASFHVEMSTGSTLNPDTVLRAAIGKSMQTLLREDGVLPLMRKLSYGLHGKHRLSSTSRRNLLDFFTAVGGSAAGPLVSALEGAPLPQHFDGGPDWVCLETTFPSSTEDDVLAQMVARMAAIDRIVEAASEQARAGDREAAERTISEAFAQSLAHWQALAPGCSARSWMLIDTALQVLASQESISTPASLHGSRLPASAALRLLSPRAKPLGHWLRQVCEAAGCRSLGELEALLLRKGVWLRNRRISLDTLKAWSSMRPGMLMSLAGRTAVLTVVQDEAQRGALGVRFALARFLAFLCDLLRSSMEGESVTWALAQQTVADRYRSCLEGDL